MVWKVLMLIGALAGAQAAAADRPLRGASVPPNLRPAAAAGQPNLWPGTAADGPVWTDTNPFVERLLHQLSLEEKIGQMIQADIASISPADLHEYKLGSVLAGGNAAPRNDLRTTPQAWLELTNAFHEASLAEDGGSHQPIPLLFGIDAVHGHAKVLGATIFPHNVGLGAAHDPELIRRIGQATAAEVAATGIDWTFAPTVAVARDVRWGRAYESYSESPELVARYAGAMVAGLQGEPGTPQFMAPGHTLSSVKHFLGDGGTAAGRDQGDTAVSEAQLSGVHAGGYPAAIRAGALIVMASYNSWNGIKLHGNHYLLTEILKGRMGFDGFVVGDWNAHEQLPGCTKFNCAAAILAGVDMLMAPDSWKDLYRNTLAQARSGEIPEARIDDAVRRILRVKAVAGLFDQRARQRRSDAGHFEVLGSPAHRAIAREAVRKSLVLLKNAHHLLPLRPQARVLVAGAAADDIAVQSGGWSIDWQGDHNSNADFPGATSIYAGIEAAVRRAGGRAAWSRDGRFTQRPDVAIVVFGESPYAEFQGDRETLAYSPDDNTDLSILRRLRARGVPTVAVFISGRPLWVNRELNASDAFVAAWLPGSEGEGIADVLFRASDGSVPFDFTGRLAFSWPLTAMPVTFDDAGQVTGALYANGFGLDYRDGSPVAVRLPEDARVSPAFRAPRGSLFHAAHPTAPWSLFLADGGAEVHLTNSKQASPHGAVSVVLAPVGAIAHWSGTQPGMLRISGRASDMGRRARDGAVIEVRYRIDHAPEGRVSLGMRCADPECGIGRGAMLDLTRTFRAARVGAWQTLAIPVSCLAAGADLTQVDVPFAVEASGEFGVTISEVRVLSEAKPARTPCPPPADPIR
ncbi:MAG: exo 1,3/1,4-beta-D-glucan glucohydrolase [Pseudomonadota bacterium]|nr:exo 1,3/1,4-beta-D-glucan glucohydrolase [Pseudomonadota bacterium]